MTPRDEQSDIGCLEALEMFYAYLDGELEAVSAAEFQHHLEHCLSCYSRVELDELVTERLKKAASQRASAGLRQRMRDLFEELE
jgi:mycothiol system anti-sigma-R factor